MGNRVVPIPIQQSKKTGNHDGVMAPGQDGSRDDLAGGKGGAQRDPMGGVFSSARDGVPDPTRPTQ